MGITATSLIGTNKKQGSIPVMVGNEGLEPSQCYH